MMQKNLFCNPLTELEKLRQEDYGKLREKEREEHAVECGPYCDEDEEGEDDHAWWDDYSDDEDERYDEDNGYDDEEDDDTRKTYSDYIVSLEDNAPHAGDVDGLNRWQWEDWIRYEAQLHDETIDDEDVERIVRILEDDGYVKEENYDDD